MHKKFEILLIEWSIFLIEPGLNFPIKQSTHKFESISGLVFCMAQMHIGCFKSVIFKSLLAKDIKTY